MLERGVEVHRYSMQGKQLRPSYSLDLSMSFARMFWCNAGGQCFIGYDPEDEFIWLLKSSFENYQPAVKNEFRTRAVYYEATNNEIIVVGIDQATVYALV